MEASVCEGAVTVKEDVRVRPRGAHRRRVRRAAPASEHRVRVEQPVPDLKPTRRRRRRQTLDLVEPSKRLSLGSSYESFSQTSCLNRCNAHGSTSI